MNVVPLGYRLEPAGYIRVSDNSGPYRVSAAGAVTLMSTGAAPTGPETGDVSIGYRLEPAGYIDTSDESGPYAINGAGAATLL